MLVIRATVTTDQEIVLDRQTFDQLVQRANQIEAVKVEEIESQLSSRYIRKSFDDEHLALLLAANYIMPTEQQEQMQELLEKNSEGQFTPAENDELDNLIDEYERRTMEKAEALVKLNENRDDIASQGSQRCLRFFPVCLWHRQAFSIFRFPFLTPSQIKIIYTCLAVITPNIIHSIPITKSPKIKPRKKGMARWYPFILP